MSAELLAKQRRRRDKPQLSCNPCRKRKVRCDRSIPCQTCVSRGEHDICVYGPHPPAVSRIHQSDHDHKQPHHARSAIHEDVVPIPDPHLNEASAEQDPAIAGAADLVGSENWPNIENIFPSGERTGEGQPSHLPQLLLGLREGTTVKSLLASVPPKAQVDRLLSKYFNSLDLAVWVSHPPTFQDQYDRFWEDQTSAMPNWLSILFSIMCLATDLMLHSGQPLPLTDSTGQQSVITFRKCSAQCLLLSNYTRPTTHTVDALLLYFYTELLHLHDTDFGLHLVLTMMIRVAMKMNYHRDSSHGPEISIFTGEMRRRVWALLVQLDILVSLQVGLPRIIDERDCDTKAPRNIPAEELHPDMTTLPASRSESGSAPGSYMRARSSLISVLGQIHDQLTSVHPLDYKTVVQLDEMLNAQHKALPQGLQVHKSPRVTDSSAAVMRSLSLDLLFQKSRCVLHQRYMTPQNRLSWETCIDAAPAIIRHQSYVYRETQSGVLLSGHLWKITYLATYDFLLGSMLLCFGLQAGVNVTGDRSYDGRQEAMRSALQESYSIWTAWYGELKGSEQVLETVKRMLDRVKGGDKSSPGDDIQNHSLTTASGSELLGLGTAPGDVYFPFTSAPEASQTAGLQPPAYSLHDSPEDRLPASPAGPIDPMDGFDWAAWDNHLQENGVYSQLSARDMVF